ncbi:F-type H+-transporting ATPase subunit g [Vigna unguiculata]|uniref:F-type H+-transporting ATPase subunit g n=1 Tax=Vigna unguiculata TaxID=3917 RepID=A0A4D6L9I4_VIGUN|nr:F-type H+-transporting ATPase subunit g [Vigna unguiculata]
MASKLHQLQSKACQASQLVAKHGSNYYRQLLEQNKQYIQEPPTVEKVNLLSKQLFYTRLAREVSRHVMSSNGFLLLFDRLGETS